MNSTDFDTAVINSSPLICLAKAGLLRLLIASFDKIIVPLDVFNEILCGCDDDSAKIFLNDSDEYIVAELMHVDNQIVEWDLGKGETSVLQYALDNKDVIAVIDDAAARKCANVMGVAYCGTLGVLAKCKKIGLVNDIGSCVHALKDSGLWLSQKLIDKMTCPE